MDLDSSFAFQSTTPLMPTTSASTAPKPPLVADSDVLQGLVGEWEGTGLNLIWRPVQLSEGNDRFLEINVTTEKLRFAEIPGAIPNRGLLQGDLSMAGLHYLQQVSDSNLHQGLHVEPGVWLSIPATDDPPVPPSVARLASIPHGTTIVAQGMATSTDEAPNIPSASITPGGPDGSPFFEQDLENTTLFRTSGVGLTGVVQGMLDNPNILLAPSEMKIVRTTEYHVFTSAAAPLIGGGTANTAFLQGLPTSDAPPPATGPNALAAQLESIFWLQTTEGSELPDILQYTQTVTLTFNGIDWPHVSVATLHRKRHLL